MLDANVLISGALAKNRPESTPGRIVLAWQAQRFRVIVTDPLLNEITRNLARLHFGGRLPLADLDAFLLFLRTEAEVVPLAVSVQGVATHPEDDLILATAVSAGTDTLVSGDRQLLALGSFRGIDIIAPSTFLATIE